MKNAKQKLVYLLRKFQLLQLADDLRYLLARKNTWRINKDFKKEQPDFVFPPEYLAYDAYSHCNWPVYYYTGRAHAKYIAQLIRDNLDEPSPMICEWGCGPARIIRHMVEFFDGAGIQLQGFDYNAATIRWCKEHISGINFDCNSLSPPLPCEDNAYDCVYNLSVFTHLSETMHHQWMAELRRVVKPGGIIIFTTHGDHFINNLLPHELTAYQAGSLVVRGEIKEGKRCFVAYHPAAFIKKELLVDDLELITHFPGPVQESLPHDVWVIRNNKPGD